MPEPTDYNSWTLEALQAKAKKYRNRELISAVFTGFLAGILVYGVVQKGIGFLHIFLPLALIWVNYRNTQAIKETLRRIRAAISSKNA